MNSKNQKTEKRHLRKTVRARTFFIIGKKEKLFFSITNLFFHLSDAATGKNAKICQNVNCITHPKERKAFAKTN